jgi:hypothetical protein
VLARVRTGLVWGLTGAMIGILLSYYLYRVGIPITPFVYQAF